MTTRDDLSPIAQVLALLRRFGFAADKCDGKSLDLSRESPQNINYLKNVLGELGNPWRLENGKIHVSDGGDLPSEFQFAECCRQHHCWSGAGADWDGNLSLFEPYIGSLARFFNEIGLATETSCEGHYKAQPSYPKRLAHDPRGWENWPNVQIRTYFGAHPNQQEFADAPELAASFVRQADTESQLTVVSSDLIEFLPKGADFQFPPVRLPKTVDDLIPVWTGIGTVAVRLWEKKQECQEVVEAARLQF